MGSLGKVTASGIRLRCKCVGNPEPSVKAGSRQAVFRPKTTRSREEALSADQLGKEVTVVNRVGRAASRTSSRAAPAEVRRGTRAGGEGSAFRSRTRPDPSERGSTARLWTHSIAKESSSSRHEQLPQLLDERHHMQLWGSSGPPYHTGEVGRGTGGVGCPREDEAHYGGTRDSVLLCPSGATHFQVGREGAGCVCAALQEELEKTRGEMTRLQESFDKLKEDFAAHREEAQREAALHTASLEEKEVQLEHLKEVIFELEDEVEQHRAMKLHDNLNITTLEDFVRKLQDEKHDMDREIKALQRKYKDESVEWHQLRADLHTAVVVAGDIASSAKDEVEVLRQCLLHAQRRNDELSRELEEQRNHRTAEERAQVHTHTRDPSALSSGTRPNRWCPPFSSPNVRSLIRSFDCISQGPSPGPSCSAAASVRTPFSCNPLKTPPAATVYPLQRPCVDGTPPVAHDPSFPTDSVYDKSVEDIISTSQVCHLGVAADIVSDVVSSTTSPVSSCSREKVQKDVNPYSATVALSSTSRPCSTSTVPVSQGVPREQQTDPWSTLVHRTGESRWNALLRWCQRKTQGYQNIHIKNFSSSWHDGLAFCAILHSYLPKHIPFWELNSWDKRRNLTLALTVTESIGIKCTLDVDEMMWTERPDWQSVMTYIISVYEYFET